MIGNPDRRFRAECNEITPLIVSDKDVEQLCNMGAISHPKPRRPLRHAIRNYWLQALAFVVFLAVIFLFTAMGHVGN